MTTSLARRDARRNPTLILLLLGSLCVVNPFAVDMYLPAFAQLARLYRTGTSEIPLTLTTYFLGFALGQILYGPLLDRFGRKRPLYAGLCAYILTSIGCTLAPDLRSLAVLRLFEALGGCVSQVAAIAMVRDFFPAKESARIFSLLFLMIGVSPLLAPTIGSAIVSTLGWQWIFYILAAMAAMILVGVFFLLPEGHQPDHSVSLMPGPIVAGFTTILRNPQFLTYTLAASFSFAGLLGFVAGSPVIFMDRFHVTARGFGIVFAVLVMGFIGGNQLNIMLLRRFSSGQIFSAALIGQVVVAAGFVLGTRLHVLNFAAIVTLFFLYLSCIGLTNPNGSAIGLAPFTTDAGRASALLGFLQTGLGAAVSMGISLLGSDWIVALLAATAFIALIVLKVGERTIPILIEAHDGESVLIH